MLKSLKYFLQQSWLLIVASFCFGLVLAIADAAWRPIIEQNKTEKVTQKLRGLFKQGQRFELIFDDTQLSLGEAETAVVDVYKVMSSTGEVVGWAFTCSGSGFADKIELVVGVGRGFDEFNGYAVIASNETPGFGDRIKNDYYRDQFEGAPAKLLELVKSGNAEKIDREIVAISGATVSSEAVVSIINDYIQPVRRMLKEKGIISNGG